METISHLIARFLKERGVDRVFSLCGGHILPIWDSLNGLGIRIIDVRDERAAVHMAHAHRELSGGLGVALVTAGPGMTNAITGIANAHVSRVPLLVISGVPPRPQENMGALQAVQQADMVRPITRWARTVTRAEHVVRELDEALACAEGYGHEPGPAFIDFPTDLLREQVFPAFYEPIRFRQTPPLWVMPLAEDIEAAARLIRQARRPLLITGRGARGSEKILLRILDELGGVCLDTSESRYLIPEDHPACIPAMRGRAMQEADLVITVGRTLDFQLGYGSSAVFPNARFVRIGAFGSEVRGNRRGDIELLGSPRGILEALLESFKGFPCELDEAWVEGLRAADRERRLRLIRDMESIPPGRDGAMHPLRLLGCVRKKLKKDAVVVADGGDFLSFSRIAVTGGAYLDCGPFGCLGIGIPFGIAASLAFPDRQVVVLSGDGSLGFNAIELDTCRRHGARVVFIVANNAGWNIERNDQIQSYAGRIVGTELEGCNYADLARSLGISGERVETMEELPVALDLAFQNAPALLDVMVTRDAVSQDSLAGLPVVPDHQALKLWDNLERARMAKLAGS